MSILISEISADEYGQTVEAIDFKLPLWLSPKYINCYEEKLILKAVAGKELRAVWVVPITTVDGVKIAKRNYRFLPYATPLIFEVDNLKRREITSKFFEYLTGKCDSIYLPFDPEFKDLQAIQSHGALIEWRNTHLLYQALNFDNMGGSLRNNIRYANNNIEIRTETDPEIFRFDKAIKCEGDERILRKKLAENLLGNDQAVIINATEKGKTCAGILLAFDQKTAYMIHTWQMDETPRGTISALIFEAVNWTFNVKKLNVYDFEGSVINNIDYFFSSFNADIVPYGFIHWSATEAGLANLIERSLKIDGRVIYDKSKIQ